MDEINLNGIWVSSGEIIKIEFNGGNYTMAYSGENFSGTFHQVPNEKRNQMDIVLSNNPIGLSIYMTYPGDENQLCFEFRHDLKREPQKV